MSKGEQMDLLSITFWRFPIPPPLKPFLTKVLILPPSLRTMALRLHLSKLEMIQHMILSKSLTALQTAKAAECSKRSIINISNNLRRFGNVRAPLTRVGRRRSITPTMLEALCDRLLEKPGLYVDEMAIFLWDEFCV